MNKKVLKKSLEKFTLMKKRAGFSELELDTFQAEQVKQPRQTITLRIVEK